MADVSSLLDKRFSGNKSKKMHELAKQSTRGELSSFSGFFRTEPLSPVEQEALSSILKNYNRFESDVEKDLHLLIDISSEVKAINHQAIILHGERIKRAQEILKNYKEGAFTAWLIATYGNRQTPYNFLQYYEFSKSLPETLKVKLHEMPRQAIYALASREGDESRKWGLIQSYQGETKQALLEMIRKAFPLDERDGRKQNLPSVANATLTTLLKSLQEGDYAPNKAEKRRILALLKELKNLTQERCKNLS